MIKIRKELDDIVKDEVEKKNNKYMTQGYVFQKVGYFSDWFYYYTFYVDSIFINKFCEVDFFYICFIFILIFSIQLDSEFYTRI